MFGTGDIITDDGLNEIYYDFIREKIKKRFLKKDGLKHGLYESYDEEGVITEFGNYNKGQKDGEWKYYEENYNFILERIKTKTTGNYNKGQKDGEWGYYEDEIIKKIVVFKDDIEISTKYLDENGQLHREDCIIDNKIVSKFFFEGNEVMKYENITKKVHEEKTILSPVMFDDWKEKTDDSIFPGYKSCIVNFNQNKIPVETWKDSFDNIMLKGHIFRSIQEYLVRLNENVRTNYGIQVNLKLKIINDFIFVEVNDGISLFSGSLNHIDYLNGEKIN